MQANWDQNDDSAADYVRGRTHYVGTKHDVRVIKQTYGKFSPELGLIVGNTYRVDYDRGSGFGVGEEFVCKDLNEGKDGIEPAPYVGHANGNGNPDPYLIFDNSIDLLPAFDHMVNIKGWKIEGDFADIKTLDTKYIDPKLLERIKALEDGGGVAGVSSVNGETGHVTITASGIGAATPNEVTSAVNSAWAEAQKTLGPLFDAKQPKGDYITQDGLQDATNAALAQAKASGEFDGAQGPKGDPGAAGPTGPAGAGLDVTGATVGQTVKISAVDANGVPTAWVPVDMASGGGAKGEPTLIAQIDFEQNSVHVITQSELANLTELIFISLGVKSTATIQSYYALYINDQRICANLVPIQVSSSSDSWNFAGTVRYNGIFWEPRLQNTHAGADPTGSVSAYISSSQSGILGVGPATKITLMVPNPLYKAVAGTLSIYGR